MVPAIITLIHKLTYNSTKPVTDIRQLSRLVLNKFSSVFGDWIR